MTLAEPTTSLLSTVSGPVPVPAILDRRERMAGFVEMLRTCGYDLESCAARLEVFPRLGVNFWQTIRPDWIARANDPIDNLIALFIEVIQ